MTAGLFDNQAVEMDDKPPPPAPDNVEKDIGEHARSIEHTPINNDETLQSDKQRLLQEMKSRIGKHQVSASELSFAPPWILK